MSCNVRAHKCNIKNTVNQHEYLLCMFLLLRETFHKMNNEHDVRCMNENIYNFQSGSISLYHQMVISSNGNSITTQYIKMIYYYALYGILYLMHISNEVSYLRSEY